MSLANEGSADAGNPGDAQSAEVNRSASAPESSPWAGLQDAENRTTAEKKGWKSYDDPIKSYRELEKTALFLPKDDAPPEAWDKVYAKLGRPEKPEAYEFKRPDGLPADMPYDEGFAKVAKGWFHEAGANGKQAQALHDKFLAFQAERAKEQVVALNKTVEESHARCVKEWGPEDSDAFKANREKVSKVLNKLGLLESFQKSGHITHDKALADASLAIGLAQVADRILGDDKIDGVAAMAAAANPFKPGSEHSVTGQALLIKKDRDLAYRLAKEAGVKDPDIVVYGKKLK